MGWILRLVLFMLLITVVLRSAYRFLYGVIEGAGMDSPRVSQRRRTQVTGHMVKDPVCGTYVVQGRAVTAVRNGETAWFCSAECQRAWLSGESERKGVTRG
jgi:YHS domain-containing protein